MNMRDWIKIFLICAVIEISIAYEKSNSTKVLSRKKRYLVFPDGSSFQLVFCAQNQGYIQVGDIVWFGNTAALAWELPKDPNIFQYLISSEKKFFEGNRRQDTHVVYFNDDGKVLAKVPYRKSFIVNPAFAKRSIDTTEEINIVSKKKMHDAQTNKNVIDELDDMSIQFHREGRQSLYAKVEKILAGLGWSGKECVRRLLCEHAKIQNEQGTFIHEIMRTTFTFPRGAKSEEHKDYDVPHLIEGECAKRFPECEDPHGVLFHSK